MARRKPKTISPVTVVDIAQKGKAIGKDEEGIVYLLEGVVPGDVVEFLFYKKRKGMRTGKVTQILEYSPERVTPKCDHFDVCGGCQLQQLSYASQLFYKEKSVKDAIRKIGKEDPEKVEPIVPADPQYNYRNKLKFGFANDQWLTDKQIASDEQFEKKNALGYHKAGCYYKLIDIHTCHLQEDLSNDIRNYLRDLAEREGYSFFDIRENTGFLRNVVVWNTTMGEWMMMLIVGENDQVKIQSYLADVVKTFPQLTSVYYMVNQKLNDSFFDLPAVHFHGEPHIREKLGNVTFKIGPKSFFQTNTSQTIKLYDLIVKLAEFKPGDTVYDLYTGVGSIALYVSQFCTSVVGIETIPEAIEDAKDNCAYNNIENATFYAGDVKDVLEESFVNVHGKPNVVIIDPPREGLHKKVIQTLLDIASPTLVYVSCNPSTQARDIEMLSEKYELTTIIPVDMFPQTYHVESIAQLKLK